ncbi:MAG: tetratricopeptide repeat protein [Bacteroidota bacterium]
MMIRLFPLVLVILFSITTLSAQENISWRKHKKLADNLFEATQYVDAAAHYEAAWQQQPKEIELIFKTGEAYYLVKDFKKAIQALQHVKTENKRFPLVGLKYARALKQDGQYELAKDEFIYFINAYQGADKAVVSLIVANEIKGCEQGIALIANRPEATIQVKHLSENLNSPAIEFAPIPYSDDLLYYSSTMKGNQSYLFRSQRKNGQWNKAVIAEGLPDFPNKHFANGSFAPNAKRFYFTLCDNGDGLNSRCEIYVLKREQKKWSEPIRLRDYINIDHATTTTQPWVVHQNGQEILYFASDREGGFGQMDIWYATRSINSDDIDFTYPVNAGAKINSLGDEITPFYDLKRSTLYYSSNGKITLGGWDVFQARGALDQWETPENMGSPINSSADEFYYVLKPSGKGGFFTSNRLYGPEKVSTQHEDLFEFGESTKVTTLNALGQVMDSETMLPISNVRISLFELVDGKAKLLSSKKIAQSNYRFQILPDKKLRLVAEKAGYLKNVYDFDSYDADGTIDYTHIFSLSSQQSNIVAANPNEKVTPSTISASNGGMDETIISSPRMSTEGKAPVNKGRAKASASIQIANRETAKTSRIAYKVQVVAVNYHDINHPRYKYVKSLGKIETERLADRGITRVLITDLADKKVATNIKEKVVQYGFVDAFVVKYQNGKRIGRIW